MLSNPVVFLHLFCMLFIIDSVNKHLLNAYIMSSFVGDAYNTEEKKTYKVLVFIVFIYYWERQIANK